MAPQNTVAVSSQPQPVHQQPVDQTPTKAKKRKSKQASKALKTDSTEETTSVDAKTAAGPPKQQQQQQQQPNNSPPAVVPSERASLKRQVSKESPRAQRRGLNGASAEPTVVGSQPAPSQVSSLAKKQLSEDADDIDAGIELDGSSNSGSSVKDINDDQMKSASVSPVMSGSSAAGGADKTGSGGLINGTSAVKKLSMTKQQLAANQQVIDADEQLLQQKLQDKQRKTEEAPPKRAPQTPGGLQRAPSKEAPEETSAGLKKSSSKRKFSPQSSLDGQPSSVCKVCEQHVYQMERMLAEKSLYHKQCFRCHQCKIQLRAENYASHEGQVYCKAHHRQLLQPQAKLEDENEADVVAKSTSRVVDEYLLHRGQLPISCFPSNSLEGIRQRQMIICENEPAELPSDVVRCDTKVDDGIDQINLNLNNILEKFERGTATSASEGSPPVVIEKPTFSIKQALMAFESRLSSQEKEANAEAPSPSAVSERPVVRKLANLDSLFNRQPSQETSDAEPKEPAKPLAVRRSESLMMRLKKYESRIAGEHVEDDDDDNDHEGEGDDDGRSARKEAGKEEAKQNGLREASTKSLVATRLAEAARAQAAAPKLTKTTRVPTKLTSIDLTSLRGQWESGDISKRRPADDDDEDDQGNRDASAAAHTTGDIIYSNGNSPLVEKEEELSRVRQQLASKVRASSGQSGSNSVKNIYENAIRESQLSQQRKRRDSSDLSALTGVSAADVQRQLLRQNSNDDPSGANSQNKSSQASNNKDNFQSLNLSQRANKLREKFELGLISNSSQDDPDADDPEAESPGLSKLEQLRQEKLDDLSVFTDGEIKAREARSLFQQIDRRLSAASSSSGPASRPLTSNSASTRAKLSKQPSTEQTPLTNSHQQPNRHSNGTNNHPQNASTIQQQEHEPQPIRLTNNVKT